MFYGGRTHGILVLCLTVIALAIAGEALAKRGDAFEALKERQLAHLARCTGRDSYGGCLAPVKRPLKGALREVTRPQPVGGGRSLESLEPASEPDPNGAASVALQTSKELQLEPLPPRRGSTIPPAAEAPSEEPPAAEPPSGGSPPEEPPAGEPPLQEPPAEEPPAEEPPAEEPPTEEPPVEEPPSEAPAPLFNGAFLPGFPGWYLQALDYRVSLVSTNPFRGQTAARFEVQQGDVEPDTGSSRAEVSGPTFDEGQDIYVRDAIRIPPGNTFNGPWQLINQLHEDDWGGSPGIATLLNDERRLSLSAGDGSPAYWHGPQLQLERWYELIYRVNLSQDSRQGFVEIWLDGIPQTLNNGQTRQYGQTIQTDSTYLKVGIYRSRESTGTSVVEHSGIAVGTSLASVFGG